MRAATRRSLPHRRLLLGPADPHVVGHGLDERAQHVVAREAEHVVHAVLLAPRHCFGAAVVPVAADGDAGPGPVRPDQAHEPAQVAAHLLARGRLARPEQHRHGPGGRRVVHVDRQEAALAVVAVEQGKLLVAVHDIHRAVDVQHHCGRRPGVARAVEGHHRPHHARHLAQRRRVLPARHGRLRRQAPPRVGQPPAGELQARVVPQPVQVVRVLVAAGDGQHAGA